MKTVRKVVIPAAGYGTRFLPVTKTVPKELFPIGNKPAIQYVVEEAIASGIQEIIFVLSRGKEMVADYFKPDQALELFLKKKGKEEELSEIRQICKMAEIRVVYQEAPRGLGDAILCAEEIVAGENFLVILPDVVVDSQVPACKQLLDLCGEGWGLLLERVKREKVSSYGIVKVEEGSGGSYRIVGAVEKPKRSEAPSDLGIMGRYLFPAGIFELIRRSRPGALGEIQLTDAINDLAGNQRGFGRVCEGEIFDVGMIGGLKKAWNWYFREV